MRSKIAGVALRTSLLYAFFAALWMVLWGMSVKTLAHQSVIVAKIDAYRGWVLVAATVFLLYAILRRQMRWLEKEVDGHGQAQQLMQESQARFVTIFRSSPMGITLSKLDDGRFIDANPAVLKTLGYSREELTGHTARELGLYVSPEERDRLVDVIRTQGRLENVELEFRKKSGEIGTMLGSADLIDLSGEAHLLSMMLDITDRKRAEEACKASEVFYQAVFEHSLAGLAIIEEDGTISLVNSQLSRALGYPKEEIEGKMTWMQFLIPKDLKNLAAYHQARMADPDSVPMQYECSVTRKDGTIMHGFIRVAMIPGTKKTVFSAMEMGVRTAKGPFGKE